MLNRAVARLLAGGGGKERAIENIFFKVLEKFAKKLKKIFNEFTINFKKYFKNI